LTTEREYQGFIQKTLNIYSENDFDIRRYD
jgi:hypothetical protein